LASRSGRLAQGPDGGAYTSVRSLAPDSGVDLLLETMRSHPLGRDAAIIGEIVEDHPGMVVQTSVVGGQRVVTMLAGEQLPRIC
jgi:hydrogenase expression/formation protein HypE